MKCSVVVSSIISKISNLSFANKMHNILVRTVFLDGEMCIALL